MATIKKRGKSYRITVSNGYSIDGRQIRPSKTWVPPDGMTEKQIEKEVNRQAVLFEEQCKGIYTASGKLVKFEALAEEYLDYVEKNNLLKIKTIKGLKSCKKRTYIAIGHLRIDKITNRHVQQFIENLKEPGVNLKNNDKGLSPKTIRHYRDFISNVFNYGIKNNIISNNPCSVIDLPPLEKSKVKCYDLEMAQKFFDILYSEAPLKYQLFFTFDALGGFRNGEICGLEWPDLFFNDEIVEISRASLYTPEAGIYTESTKTEGSERFLKLPTICFKLAKLYKIEQQAQINKLGDRWHSSDRLFVTWDGHPMHPNTPYKYLIRFCLKHDLPKTTVHEFRHFNASVLIRNNVDVRTVAAALGHSDATTTLRIYAREFAEAQAKASEAIANSIILKKA